jgi:tryptophanyl-tRNA synthetase
MASRPQPLRLTRGQLRYEPRVMAGFRPAKEPHLGLYCGALKHLVLQQDRHPGATYCVLANWHALTNWQDRMSMEEATFTMAAALLSRER